MARPWYKKDVVLAAIAGSTVAGVFAIMGIVVTVETRPDTPMTPTNCYTIEQQILQIYQTDPNAIEPSTNKELISSCDINTFIQQLQKDRPAIEPAK